MKSPANHRYPKTEIFDTSIRPSRKIGHATTQPISAAMAVSDAASRRTCDWVAPARRIAASRASRVEVDRRVAVTTNSPIGRSIPSTNTHRTMSALRVRASVGPSIARERHGGERQIAGAAWPSGAPT